MVLIDLLPMRRRSAIHMTTPTTINMVADHVRLPPGGVGLLIEKISNNANGNGSDGQQPEEFAILLDIRIASDVQAEAFADDLNPIAEEVEDHGHQCARVQRDIECQARVLPTEEPRDEHQMGGAANGQEFGERLDYGKNNRLIDGHEVAIVASTPLAKINE